MPAQTAVVDDRNDGMRVPLGVPGGERSGIRGIGGPEARGRCGNEDP
jgi:hypothetical protein